jgi:hypothetical protein
VAILSHLAVVRKGFVRKGFVRKRHEFHVVRPRIFLVCARRFAECRRSGDNVSDRKRIPDFDSLRAVRHCPI